MKLPKHMNCAEWQSQLSLYLYGELDFAAEEGLEEHVSECPFCQLALAREKLWHTALNGTQKDVPGNLIAGCRKHLQTAIREEASYAAVSAVPGRWHIPEWLRINLTPISRPFALASFFVCVGIALGHWGGRMFGTGLTSPALEMGMLNSPSSRIRDIQAEADGRVRIIVDRVQQQELVGTVSDDDIRLMLLAAARDSSDPGLRIDSVELLKQRHDEDIRDALLAAAQHDENAAVRLKAIDSLRAFPSDETVRGALITVLEHDPDVSVRAQAIDALVPSDRRWNAGPDLVRTLRGISRSADEDDYIRMRCEQALRLAAVPESY